jgi:hypothetical protein
LLAQADEDITAAVGESLRNNLERKVKIPARKNALAELRSLSQERFESVVQDVRHGRLTGEALIRRLREISGVEGS